MVAGILILGLILLVMPVIAGSLFCHVDQDAPRLLLAWVGGQMLLWAGFLAVCVPMVLRKGRLSEVIGLYLALCGLLLAAAAGKYVVQRRRKTSENARVQRKGLSYKQSAPVWCLFAVLLLIQLAAAGMLAYEEGDDAFYVAVATGTESSDTLYDILPYTGATTGTDARHGLAPFPVWTAFLARLSGIHPATVNQIVLPVVLIAMAYAILGLLGCRLFEKDPKKTGLFLAIAEVLILFGGQSLYTAENFLLVRTAQGKAVLANMVLPFLLYLCFVMTDACRRGERPSVSLWLLMASAAAAGCLCSTQGALLTSIMIGGIGLLTAASFRRLRILLPTGICCLLPMGMAVLYLLL